jgi:type I restriction-modification system DNA methylase subunit
MIPQTFAESYQRVKELVEVFKENAGRYLSPDYSEAQARLDFIDKFWIALGWDVNHETQTNPYRQEVKVERGVATNEWRKRADYAFLAPNFRDVRFFVEAKKPHAGLDNPLFYFQTIRYGWNSHIPLSILTDFEELRVLDCRYKPNIDTVLGQAALKYHYTDYSNVETFRTLYYLFSRAAVADGSIEQFAAGLPKLGKRTMRGVAGDKHQSIDEAFLKELDEYRDEFARSFKRNNQALDGPALTEATQRTLDRLVFMRFLEDKLIEDEPLVEDLNRRGDSWKNFVSSSRRLNKIYNGIIFKEHPILDSANFQVDEKIFRRIVTNLSHRNSPYDFNAIPIHILGSIYERFLGKVIVATDRRARVEEKPQVRKAGGVYYTPEYIVRYIVDNTVGKLIEGMTPKEIREMRFADIACGSGSFLLGIYDYLLRYHTAYYNRTKRNQAEGKKAGCIPTEGNALRLSLLQKRTILLTNIYGIDVDPTAVEVAQLSLYLKLLEDETIASAHQQQLEMRQALLPSLSSNIVSGNSLVSWDIFEGQLFTSNEAVLNPMEFGDKFPEVMKRGGFDAVIGNPPYVLLQGELRDDFQLQYFRRNYQAASYKLDTYHLFIERGISLTKSSGRCSMITPANFLTNNYLAPLRRLILERSHLEHITIIDQGVFRGASVDNAIFVTTAGRPTEHFSVIHATPTSAGIREESNTPLSATDVLNERYALLTSSSRTGNGNNLWSLVSSRSKPLSSIAYVNFGKQLRDRQKFTKDVIRVDSIDDVPTGYRPCYTGRDIHRLYSRMERTRLLK